MKTGRVGNRGADMQLDGGSRTEKQIQMVYCLTRGDDSNALSKGHKMNWKCWEDAE